MRFAACFWHSSAIFASADRTLTEKLLGWDFFQNKLHDTVSAIHGEAMQPRSLSSMGNSCRHVISGAWIFHSLPNRTRRRSTVLWRSSPSSMRLHKRKQLVAEACFGRPLCFLFWQHGQQSNIETVTFSVTRYECSHYSNSNHFSISFRKYRL